VLMIGVAAILWLIQRATKYLGENTSRWSWGIVLLFAPLFFSVYTLTKESTAIFEIVLRALGV